MNEEPKIELPLCEKGCTWEYRGTVQKIGEIPDDADRWEAYSVGGVWHYWEAVPIADHTEVGKYRMLKVGEAILPTDEVKLGSDWWGCMGKDAGPDSKVGESGAYPVGYYRRPIVLESGCTDIEKLRRQVGQMEAENRSLQEQRDELRRALDKASLSPGAQIESRYVAMLEKKAAENSALRRELAAAQGRSLLQETYISTLHSKLKALIP
jgi:regulator of replication initiation timing